MKIVELNSVVEQLFDLRAKGNYPGKSTGFEKLNPFYNIRKGNTTYISGWPTSGKTSLYLQILCNTTNLYEWKHAIYTPETGVAEEVYAEIIHCLTGKSFNKNFYNCITESELYSVKDFVHSYFKVIEPEDNKCTLDDWFNAVEEIQREHNISTAGIDNWNDLEHDMSKQGNKISEYLKFQLPRFNRFAKKNNIHSFLLVHPRNPDVIKGENTVPAPRPDQIEGGSLWYAKAQSIVIVHRNWSEENSRTSEVIIAKAKPKIVGKKGRVELEYDPTAGSYFELDGGVSKYPYSLFKEQKNERENINELQAQPRGNIEGNDAVPF